MLLKKYEDITLEELEEEATLRSKELAEAIRKHASRSEIDFKKMMYEFMQTAYMMKFREVKYGSII